jgi:hypothetical protein
MVWQSSEEMTEAPVKPTVQNKASMQACCGYSVRMFWFQKGFQAKSLAPVKSTIVDASRRCNDASRRRTLEFNG